MNILITGCNGFLAKELIDYFSSSNLENNVILTDRRNLDPTNYNSVKKFFENNEIDIVIHTAVKGGKRHSMENINVLYDNLLMFHNLSSFAHKFKIMFNFGSGAEFNRKYNIKRALESEMLSKIPEDYYGLSKNLITRRIVELNSNIFNLRLFGCFGIHEENQRLFKACYNKIIKGVAPVIHQDRNMDFFYAQDVGRVIEYIIKNNDKDIPRDINLCYTVKYKISDIVTKIKSLTKDNLGVTIEKNGLANSYTGSSDRLNQLNIHLKGLEKGMEECLTKWNKFYN